MRRLFARKGYTNTETADIMKEAGRALGSFRSDFAGRDAALERLGENSKSETDPELTELEPSGSELHEMPRNLCAVHRKRCRDPLAALTAIFPESRKGGRLASPEAGSFAFPEQGRNRARWARWSVTLRGLRSPPKSMSRSLTAGGRSRPL